MILIPSLYPCQVDTSQMSANIVTAYVAMLTEPALRVETPRVRDDSQRVPGTAPQRGRLLRNGILRKDAK